MLDVVANATSGVSESTHTTHTVRSIHLLCYIEKEEAGNHRAHFEKVSQELANNHTHNTQFEKKLHRDYGTSVISEDSDDRQL